MKEEKVGLTFGNWFLSIIGIILLLMVIVLPPVCRAFLKEEVKEEPKKELITVGELLCTKNNIKENNYVDNDALIINYENDTIKSYTNRIERIYLDPVFYQEEKITYGKYVASFVNISGYQYNATPNDDTSTFMIVANYDMTKFSPTTVEIEGDENPTAITKHYLLADTLETTQNNLTTYGYTCQKNNEHKEEAK